MAGKRPNNNPFNDIQSFSSNGMGQIIGLKNKARASGHQVVMPALQKKFAAGEMDEDAQMQEADFIDDMDSMSKGSIGSNVDLNEINDANDNIRRHSIDKKHQTTKINLSNYKHLA